MIRPYVLLHYHTHHGRYHPTFSPFGLHSEIMSLYISHNVTTYFWSVSQLSTLKYEPTSIKIGSHVLERWFTISRPLCLHCIAPLKRLLTDIIYMQKFCRCDDITQNLLKIWLSLCDVYLVITASAWRNLRQCSSALSSWDSRVTENRDIRLHSGHRQFELESGGLHSVGDRHQIKDDVRALCLHGTNLTSVGVKLRHAEAVNTR